MGKVSRIITTNTDRDSDVSTHSTESLSLAVEFASSLFNCHGVVTIMFLILMFSEKNPGHVNSIAISSCPVKEQELFQSNVKI